MKKTIITVSCMLGLIGAPLSVQAAPNDDIWNKFRELQHSLETMFDEGTRLVTNVPSQIARTDVREEKDYIVVEADLAGFTPEEIKTEIHDGKVEISAEKNQKKETRKHGEGVHREQISKNVKTSIVLPVPVDETKAKATLKNGVLRVEIPKKK